MSLALSLLSADLPAACPRDPARTQYERACSLYSCMISVEDVCHFQSADRYASVFTHVAEVLIRTRLKELLAQPSPDQFRQIHRRTVVNMTAVAAAVRDDAGRLSLRLKQRKETLAVSRVYAELFRQMQAWKGGIAGREGGQEAQGGSVPWSVSYLTQFLLRRVPGNGLNGGESETSVA